MKIVQQILVNLAPALAVTGLVGAAISGFGARLNFWEFGTGFGVLKWSVYAAIGTLILAVAAAVLAKPAGAQFLDIRLLAAVIIGLTIVGIPYSFAQHFKKTPTVADATTNIEDPPSFVALVPVRQETAKNPLEYRKDEAAALQRQYFPDLTAIQADKTPAETIRQAVSVAKDMGFEIVDASPEEGRLEATDTTFWFGFKDDVVVRARLQGNGQTRIDVRSASRVGYLDGGLNARRIQDFLRKLEADLH